MQSLLARHGVAARRKSRARNATSFRKFPHALVDSAARAARERNKRARTREKARHREMRDNLERELFH
ncbi:hypothetical protein D6817_00955 [Candidatus Pacearchaeota archaeon]|nr:MAG: hypothetical protein D6817_00955 [Candidatus Pacearchaeota archaeon]